MQQKENQKALTKCPECGADTVIESETFMGETIAYERCTGLVEVDPNKPLEACQWIQDLSPESNPQP